MFDFVIRLVERTGYWGVLLLMFGENVFPPIPSEVIMPLAGFNAASGNLNLFGVLAAGAVGSMLGAIFWYYIGKRVGGERLKKWTAKYGRWFTLSPNDVEKASEWFDKHGQSAVFIGRMIPAVRTLISVPAGIANMSLGRFLFFSFIGTLIWTALLTGAGYLLESQYQKVSDYMGIISNVVVGLLVAWYLYRVVTFDPEK